jgi:hypothetical protein
MHGCVEVLDRASAFFDTFTTQVRSPFSENGVISRNYGPGVAVIKTPPAGAAQ